MTIDRIDCMFPILVTMLALLEILKCMKDCIMKGQGMLQIRYDANGESCSNHFLYGEPPYKLKEYKGWLDKTKMYTNKDK